MKENRRGHVDRISGLPDVILTQKILTLLSTKDSVRTSVLSARWRRLYASVPVLDFRHLTRKHRPDPAFASFVSKVTNTVGKILPCISKFRIHHDAPLESSNFVSWIETLIKHFVREIDVHVVLAKCVPTPPCVFICETLVSLKLDINVVLDVPDFVYFPNLKELSLRNIILKDESDFESVRKLFSSCPVLEILVIDSQSMDKAGVFNVSVPSLKVLTATIPRIWEIELLINCPNLEILRCKIYADRGYSGDVLGSLKECYIDIELFEDQFKEGKLIELVKKVSKVQFLSLAGDSMAALLIPPCSLPTFENLTHLELASYYSAGWRLLLNLLENVPRLNTLVFPRGFSERDHNEVPFSSPENAPVCLSFHLKVIRIKRFFGEDEEYKMVEYFLTNALVLEKMEICPWSSGDSEEEENGSNVEGEVENEGEDEMEVEGEGEGEGEGEANGIGEGEGEIGGEGEGESEVEGQEDFESDLERHFEITKRLLTIQRASEVCQIVLVSSDNKKD